LSVTTTFIFANKFNKLDKKYDDLKEKNEKIMSIINTDDGTGDKILNLDKELETMKSDIEDLRVSRDTINDTVGNNANEINTLKAKVKNYDENAFRAVTGWLSYNQKLSNQYNNYQNQMYYVCERSFLLGKVQDGCPK
jgi:predicted nuclease with TOPRIM domain